MNSWLLRIYVSNSPMPWPSLSAAGENARRRSSSMISPPNRSSASSALPCQSKCFTLSSCFSTSSPTSGCSACSVFVCCWEHRQSHGDVKPVDYVLAARMKVLLKPSDGLAAVGHENHLLVLFHALRFHQLPQPTAGLSS